ncbi:hypothetical protein ANN_07641 [Periplaneta americana]|uniref:Uncharacterized protein n=1 Tax=Periplaneta americana TaxID=6978 RepID=A0ABQ8T0S2_PERAM|nr:hypothetical protein ANN_07641 [Periplaneta americana]
MTVVCRVLRKIFEAKRDEVTGEWRKLHNAELQALYSLSDIIRNIKSRRLRWAGHVERKGESRNAYRVSVGRPEREDNIKTDLRKVGYDGRDWINLAQDRDQWRAYVRAAMNLKGSLKAIKQKIFSVFIIIIIIIIIIVVVVVVVVLAGIRPSGLLRSPSIFSGGVPKINDAETDQKEKKELVESLAEKKVPVEECTGRNVEQREKSSGQKKIYQ